MPTCEQERDQLRAENKRMRELGDEFIWGENNPQDYESEMTQLKARVLELERQADLDSLSLAQAHHFKAKVDELEDTTLSLRDERDQLKARVAKLEKVCPTYPQPCKCPEGTLCIAPDDIQMEKVESWREAAEAAATCSMARASSYVEPSAVVNLAIVADELLAKARALDNNTKDKD